MMTHFQTFLWVMTYLHECMKSITIMYMVECTTTFYNIWSTITRYKIIYNKLRKKRKERNAKKLLVWEMIEYSPIYLFYFISNCEVDGVLWRAVIKHKQFAKWSIK